MMCRVEYLNRADKGIGALWELALRLSGAHETLSL